MLQYETPGYFKFLLNTQQERQIAEERFVQQEISVLTKDTQPRFSTKRGSHIPHRRQTRNCRL